jgi:dolichyl-diphosphooligosaccharide--protein glycosyltransferase
MQAAFYTPLFLSFFAIIVAFLIGKKLSGNLAGFVSAMLVAVNPTVLSRSLGSDNDFVSIVFPLIIMLFVIYAFDSKSYKSILLFSVLAGFFTGIYSFAWSGWWFIFIFILLAVLAYLGYLIMVEFIKEKHNYLSIFNNLIESISFRQSFLFLSVFVLFTFLSLMLAGNSESFLSVLSRPIEVTTIQEAARGTSIWPNVYTTVAELNQADLGGILRSAGVFYISAGQKTTEFPLLVFALVGVILPIIVFKTTSQKVISLRLGFITLSFFYYLFLILFVFGAISNLTVIVLWLFIVAASYILIKNTTGESAENTHLAVSVFLSSALLFFVIFDIIYSGFRYNVIPFMVILSMPFISGTFLSVFYKYHIDIKHGLILLLWFLATIYAATKGVRFLVLMVPAFAITFSTFIDVFSRWVSGYMHRALGIHKAIVYIFVIMMLLIPIFISTKVTSTNIGYSAGYATAYNYIPSVNDGWVTSLVKINQESKTDAIINSWWDFGHWFKYFSDRAVTFDGASQNEAQAHWIGKVLITNDEKEAISILRMLDCRGNTAFAVLNSKLNDSHRSLDEIYYLFSLGKDKREAELRKLVDSETAKEVESYLFCEPPENFFITSEDMVGKSGVWAHFGSWNFERAEIYNYFKRDTMPEFISHLNEQFNYSKEQAEKLYFELNSKNTDREINDWIAPWPSYAGGTLCTNTNGNLLCNIQISSNQMLPLRINMSDREPYIASPQGETYYLNAFAYVDKGQFKVKRYNENQIGYGAVLLPDNQTVLIMSEELVDSMFTRLFYYDGLGLERFKKFYDTRDVTGARIITWKIDWPND